MTLLGLRGVPMTNYRLYPLDKSGHFLGVVEFLASDDTVACEIAERTTVGQASELWERDRLVKKFKEPAEAAGT
jgi:hypothetical protein